MPTPKTPAAGPAAPPHPEPVGTPPGGGRWSWDPWQGQWQPADDTPTETPQE